MNKNSQADDHTMLQTIWSELQDIYSVRLQDRPYYSKRLTEDDLTRWADTTGWSKILICDKIATSLAIGFHDNKFDFTFCDVVINHLFQTDTGAHYCDGIFWQVYLAFDAGEFYRPGKEDEDPSEVYTRPLIEQIVKELKQNK